MDFDFVFIIQVIGIVLKENIRIDIKIYQVIVDHDFLLIEHIINIDDGGNVVDKNMMDFVEVVNVFYLVLVVNVVVDSINVILEN